MQVKGKTHYNKKKFSADDFSYAIEVEVLRFFRDNGGGVYFCVIVHPDTRQERVFARPLAPFMLDRLLNATKPGQKTINVKLQHLSDDPNRIERLVEFSSRVSKQDPKQGFDERLWRDGSEIEIYSVDGIDLSRPAELNLATQDVAVVLNTGELRIHVNMDLKIFPANYVEHERSLVVSCGGVTYSTVHAKKIDEETGQVRLGLALTLRMEKKGKQLASELDLDTGENLSEQLKALRFFTALAEGQALQIGGDELHPEAPASTNLRGLSDTLARFEALAELFDRLDVDQRLIIPAQITGEQMETLGLAYRAVVRSEELTARSGRPGRFDIRVGSFRILLVAVPGSGESSWRFFDPFEPANREKYRLYSVSDEPEAREVHGTAYEAVNAEEIANTLNLRLGTLVQAYESLEDQGTAQGLANLKVLQFITGSDTSELDVRREALLGAAHQLNDWLLAASGGESIHRINRWQILHRAGKLSTADRDEIRALRRQIVRGDADNAGQLETCCAILLGEVEDIRQTMLALDAERRKAIEEWPIAQLIPSNAAVGYEIAASST